MCFKATITNLVHITSSSYNNTNSRHCVINNHSSTAAATQQQFWDSSCAALWSPQSGLSSWTGNTSRVKTSRNQEQTPGSRRPGRSAVRMKTLKRNNDRLGRKIFKIPRPDGCWRRRCWHAHTATINDDPIVLTSFRHVIVLTELWRDISSL